QPGDQLLDARRIERSHRDVVEKEERRGAVHEDVVRRVADEVGANRVVTVREDRDLEFGADAVDAREKDLTRRAGNSKRPGEEADVPDDSGAERGTAESLDPGDRLLPLLDADAGLLVAAHERASSRNSASGAAWDAGSAPTACSSTRAATISSSNWVPACL